MFPRLAFSLLLLSALAFGDEDDAPPTTTTTTTEEPLVVFNAASAFHKDFLATSDIEQVEEDDFDPLIRDGLGTVNGSLVGAGGSSSTNSSEEEDNGVVMDRIIGGRFARQNEFPFMVYVSSRFCGGVLLETGSNRWIATAGHCLYGVNRPFRICAGSLNRRNCVGEVRTINPSTDVFVHPGFDPRYVGAYDIGLIRLRRPLPLSASIRPAAVYTGPTLPPGFQLYSLGWGLDGIRRGASFPLQMKAAVVRLTGNLQSGCRISLPNVAPQSIYCTGAADAVGSRHCFGDSGGFLGGRSGARWVVAGLTDFSNEDCSALHGYVNINYHFGWLQHVVGNN